jgi:hypothetical protein
MKQPRRVSPRIPYEEAVCLTRVDGGGRLFGRSVNLAISGVYVKCSEPCEIGTELICNVLLPGGPRKLRGRVVRLISLARGVGMAVAFEQMTDRDRGAIEQLISDHQRAVFQAKLRLSGMDPVKCEAVFDERTVHLRAALPFLRLDADVGVVLGETEELEASGVISKIALDPASEDGVPRLALDVQLGGPHAAEDGDDDGAPPPTALPAPCAPQLPKVLVSRTLQHEAVTRAMLANHPPRPRRRGHATAEIARRPRFTDWTPPPPLSSRRRDDRTVRVQTIDRRARTARRWRYLWVFPLAAAIAAALLRVI